MKKLFLLASVLAFVGLASGAALADPVASPVTAAIAPIASHDVAAPVAAAAPAVVTAMPAMPADHSAVPMIFWIIALLGWAGATGSELCALVPGLKMNGILHGFLIALGAIKADPERQTVTIDIGEYRQLVENKPPAPES